MEGPCPWNAWVLGSLPEFWDSGIIKDCGYPREKGQSGLSHFPQQLSLILQQIHSSFPSSKNPENFLQRNPSLEPDRGKKKICQHFHGRNWIFGTSCTSRIGRFYCFVGCLGTVSVPHTQIHHSGAPSTFLGAQSLPREREEQQMGRHLEG